MYPGENAGYGLTGHADILGTIAPVIQCGEHIRLGDLYGHILPTPSERRCSLSRLQALSLTLSRE